MTVKLEPGTTPYAARVRPYSNDAKTFLNAYAERLSDFNFMYPNAGSAGSSPVVVVKKPPPTNFRWTGDLRQTNQRTEDIVWPMPALDSETHDLRGFQYPALIDFVGSYWQLPLAESCREMFSFIVPSGIYTPNRTPQGAKQSAPNFQAKVEPLFHSIRDRLKAWLDDFLVHTRVVALRRPGHPSH